MKNLNARCSGILKQTPLNNLHVDQTQAACANIITRVTLSWTVAWQSQHTGQTATKTGHQLLHHMVEM